MARGDKHHDGETAQPGTEGEPCTPACDSALLVQQTCELLQARVSDAPHVTASNLLQMVEGVIGVASQRTAALAKAEAQIETLKDFIRRTI